MLHSDAITIAPLPTLFASNFGAVSGQDATAALNAAAQGIPSSGGVLELQAGATYYLSDSLSLQSNTILEGNGATLIDAIPISQNSAGFALIDNVNFNATTMVDHNITVKDLILDYAYVDGGASHAINFRQASNIDVESVIFHGGNDATAFEATYDSIVNNCTAYNISNAAFDHWEGASDATVSNSTAYLTGSGSYGILFTGVGTSSNDQRTASGDVAFNNTIYNAGQAGIWVCALGAASADDNISLVGNAVYGGTNPGAGIGVSGAGSNILLAGNTIGSINGNNAIFIRSGEGNAPGNAIIQNNTLTAVTTPAGSVAAIQALGNSITVADNISIGGDYPSLVWAAGENDVISNNTGTNDGINANGATNPLILTGSGPDIPFSLQMFGGEVDDNAAAGTIVGFVAALDQNPSSDLSYYLIGISNGLFTIDPNNGAVRLAKAGGLNAGLSPAVILNVGVANTAAAAIEASFVITILPAAEASAGEVSRKVGTDSSSTLTISGPTGQASLEFAPTGQLSEATNTQGVNTVFHYAPGSELKLDGRPLLTSTPVAGSVEVGQTAVIGSVISGVAGDSLRLVQDGTFVGSISLGATDADGARSILYRAPANIVASSADSFSYRVIDEANNLIEAATASVQLDRGVVIQPAGRTVLAAGQSAVVDTIVAGLPGDVVTLKQSVAEYGFFALVQTVFGAAALPNQYNVVYTETKAVTASKSEIASFQVMDRTGGMVAQATPAIVLDAGPTITLSLTGVHAASAQTVVIGTVQAGLPEDVLTIDGSPSAPGSFALSSSTSGLYQILYTAPAVVPTNGVVPLAYTISDQTGKNTVSGSASAIVTDPMPTLLAQPETVVESGQSIVIGIVTPGSLNDILTVSPTSTTRGKIAIIPAGNVDKVVYTAPGTIASSATDEASYAVTDEHGGTVSGAVAVMLDCGPNLSPAAPHILVKGQSTVIGVVTPGLPGDQETLTPTDAIAGTLALVGRKVVYTAPPNPTVTGDVKLSYSISDQHGDTTASGSASVKVAAATPINDSAPITSLTAGTFLDLIGGSPTMTFLGANSVVLLEGAASPTIVDQARGLLIDVASSNVSAVVTNLTAEGWSVVELLNGVGGFRTAAAAHAALTPDGHGGTQLALGRGLIDFAGTPLSAISQTRFVIG